MLENDMLENELARIEDEYVAAGYDREAAAAYRALMGAHAAAFERLYGFDAASTLRAVNIERADAGALFHAATRNQEAETQQLGESIYNILKGQGADVRIDGSRLSGSVYITFRDSSPNPFRVRIASHKYVSGPNSRMSLRTDLQEVSSESAAGQIMAAYAAYAARGKAENHYKSLEDGSPEKAEAKKTLESAKRDYEKYFKDGRAAVEGTGKEDGFYPHVLRAATEIFPDLGKYLDGLMSDDEAAAFKKAFNARLAPQGVRIGKDGKVHYDKTDRMRMAEQTDPDAFVLFQVDNAGNAVAPGERNPKIASVVEVDPAKIVDADGKPVDLKNTAALREWLENNLLGVKVTIKSNGKIVLFEPKGISSSLNARAKEQRASYVELKKIIENAVYDDFRQNDGQAKHAHLDGQEIYYAAIRMEGKPYSVQLILDKPHLSKRQQRDTEKSKELKYKGHTVSEIKIAPSLNLGPDQHPQGHGGYPLEKGAIRGISLSVLRGDVKPSRIENGVLYQPAFEGSETPATPLAEGITEIDVDGVQRPGESRRRLFADVARRIMAKGEYEYYGIRRVQESGEEISRSRRWDDENPSNKTFWVNWDEIDKYQNDQDNYEIIETPDSEYGSYLVKDLNDFEYLDGTSAIGITADNIERGFDLLSKYGGKQIVLLGSNSVYAGEDSGEDVMRDPDVLYRSKPIGEYENIKTHTLYSMNSLGRRGSVSFDSRGGSLASFYASADLSTPIHEGAHVFINDLMRVVEDNGLRARLLFEREIAAIPADIDDRERERRRGDIGARYRRHMRGLERARADMRALRENADEQREAHGKAVGRDFEEVPPEGPLTPGQYRTLQEVNAAAFEHYLLTDNAPPPKVEGIFSRMKAWLAGVYEAAKTVAGVCVTPEAREVFDRLLSAPDGDEDEESAAGPVP